MRARQVAAGAILGALLLVAAPAASTGDGRSGVARHGCASLGTTIDINRYARIYRRGPVGGAVYSACWLRSGRTYRLGRDVMGSSTAGVAKLRLSGRHVAYEHWECPRGEPCVAGADVRNLRTGARRGAGTGAGRFRALVLNARGAVAWIQGEEPEKLTVWLLDREGHVELASGAGIEPASLAINRHHVYWLQAGDPQVAAVR